MKKISILVPCYNESGNVRNMYEAITSVMKKVKNYDYEQLYIDNCSGDNTWEILKDIAAHDKKVKVIENEANFGPGRSGSYGMYQTTGDASICLACDFQDPPELIPRFIKKWEEGYKVVWGRKTGSKENKLMYGIRTIYYKIIKALSSVEQYEQVTGFGLYDKEVVTRMKNSGEPSPIFRNLVADYGYRIGFVDYYQPERKNGKSSYNFFSYFDTAMQSLINTSKIPLKLAMFIGALISGISFIIALIYLILKLIYWNRFIAGAAPIVIGIFFLGGVQLLFLGIIGEYVGEILTRVTNRPLVVEHERLNFDEEGEKSETHLKT